MLVGRILVGIGLGIGPPVASLYVTEISPAHVRGTYGSFIQIATCLGLMAALVVGIPVALLLLDVYLSRFNASSFNGVLCRISTLAIQGLSLVKSFVLYFNLLRQPAVFHSLQKLLNTLTSETGKGSDVFFHARSSSRLESVSRLPVALEQGRHGEAENELEKLLGASHAKDAIVQLSKTQRGDEIDTIKLAELLCGRHSRGTRAGVSSNLANVCVGIANLIGSFIALALMDKLGRKALLLWSFFGMAASAGLQVLAAASPPSNTIGFLLSVGGMMLFVLMFAVGAGPVPGLLLPEIFDNRIRAKAMAFCMSVHWVANFLVGLLFLRLLDRMGPQLLYSMFGSFCLLAVVFVKQNVLETKGKSLQEIEIALLAQDQS
ncbi:hypothetical protein SASPL_123754 [Salvia splendens]|uniref:Major facilitator superfamily (MFS) profile domain-containing protein n=1 Tax=Salvia splendens TaxID=180675 RepID=A0A8X8XRR9_SALSN|nr:hypothetical protein SASPL_123754 [Salvia splendens]